MRGAVVSSSANTREILVAAGIACVVDVDRAGQAEALREHGPSIVVSDFSELLEDR